jgi:uncharacterized membrane protein YqjE
VAETLLKNVRGSARVLHGEPSMATNPMTRMPVTPEPGAARPSPPTVSVAVSGPVSERTPEMLERMPTSALVREVVDGTRELVRLEVQLARAELTTELRRATRAAVATGVTLVAFILFLAMIALMVVLAAGGTVVAALVAAAVFLVIGGMAALVGFIAAPRRPLVRTRERLENDVNQLKEHFA